ncbi:MAG: LacI family transcriptional regulator [Lachnospiraceae bacterium]|nr:LacI family transcriptional regulator [Lachnospiraceae bacterium]
MPTIKEISKACGVSPATVSKALNDYPDVSEETKEIVRACAKDLHYLPNAAARQLKTNTSHNIGVVYKDSTGSGLSHEYFSAVLDSAKEEAEKNGYDITFISDVIGYGSYLEHCRYRRCDGVLMVSEEFSSPQMQELISSSVPVVLIDYVVNERSSILSDNIDGGYSLANYFINKGHKRIAFVHGERTSVTVKRLKGFYKAMEESGINVPDEYIVQARFHDPDSSSDATKKLMALNNPPTAIMYPDDFSYIGGMNALEKLGLSIPDDVSVAGYDGVNLSQVLRPKLTTYYQNAAEIGRVSAKKLIETIEQPKSCIAEQIIISGKILEGKSVATLRE